MPTSRPPKPKKDPHAASVAVENLLRDLKHPRDAEIRAVRAIILASDARVKEDVKWNAPSFYTTEHFATFHLRAKDGVQIVLHLGAKPQPDASLRADIADPGSLLVWKSPDRATVTFRDTAHVRRESAAFTRLVKQWITHVSR